MSPDSAADQIRAAFELGVQLRGQMPPDFEVILDVDVDLQLAAEDAPGTVRRPDVIVVSREARLRTRRDGGVIRASEVLVAVEVLSSGSRRTDHVHKRGEYVDAGIPRYWILDASEPVSLLACHLADEFGYADVGAVAGSFSAADPFPARIDLDALL
jgi:Uma2 family endonuclease